MKKSFLCCFLLIFVLLLGSAPTAWAGCSEECAHLKKQGEEASAEAGEEGVKSAWRKCIDQCEEKEGEKLRESYEESKDYVMEKTEDLREGAAKRYEDGKRKVRNWRRGWRNAEQE